MTIAPKTRLSRARTYLWNMSNSAMTVIKKSMIVYFTDGGVIQRPVPAVASLTNLINPKMTKYPIAKGKNMYANNKNMIVCNKSLLILKTIPTLNKKATMTFT